MKIMNDKLYEIRRIAVQYVEGHKQKQGSQRHQSSTSQQWG